MNSKLPHLKVKGFRTVDEPILCKQYLKGHVKVLADFGIANITSNNNLWIQNPNIYCLIIEDYNTNEMLGGIRIQLADGILPLPVEEAVGYMDTQIYDIVTHFALNGGIGELSGLWIDNRLRGLGIGVYMVRAAIASSSQLNFKTMTGICGDVTLKMFNNVGFVVDKSVGNNGKFYYPNDKLIAHLVGILNAITLEDAAKYDKEIMTSLRANLNQQRIEKDTGKKVIIDYNIKYPIIKDLIYINKK
ncbi:MAG: hypothetical protein H6587_00630 [Flavobacteriales bacterium]|nr:hypothetical protein [Flavobacteriales bacterium]